MAKKWSNEDLPGALHFITGNVNKRLNIFKDRRNCEAFIDVLNDLRMRRPYKLIAYVLMPDHFHLITNPKDDKCKAWTSALKSLTAKKLIELNPGKFTIGEDKNQVWQESFKGLQLWSGWMVWQKINYIHANPLKAKLVTTTAEYEWSSFRSFYNLENPGNCLVDEEWFWEGDLEKIKRALMISQKEREQATLPDLKLLFCS